MYYAYKYRLEPSDAHREELDRHRDICRQLYNHALHRFNQIPDDAGTVKQRVRSIRDELPDLKQWWDGLSGVYSTVLQTAVMRIADNIKRLGILKRNGRRVGQLKWKSPRDLPQFHLQSIRLRTQEHEWSDATVTFETRRYPDSTPPRDSRRREAQAGHAQERADRRMVRCVWRRDTRRPAGETRESKAVRRYRRGDSLVHTRYKRNLGRVTRLAQTNATAWNASNGNSRGRNMVRRTTRNNDVGWQSATRISRTNGVTSCTNSRTTTLGSTISSRLKT